MNNEDDDTSETQQSEELEPTHSGVAMKRLYNLKDICSLINKSQSAVGTWVKIHQAPHRVIRRTIYIDISELWDWHTEFMKKRFSRKEEHFDSAKERKELAQAEKVEFEVEILKNNYLKRSLVEKVAFERGQHIKEALNAIPERLTSVLIGQQDEKTIHDILQQEVDRILQDISQKVLPIEEVDEEKLEDFDESGE